MGFTIEFKGTLKEGATAQDVYGAALPVAEGIGWPCTLDVGQVVVDPADGQGEEIWLDLREGSMDGCCKLILSEPGEFIALMDLFYAVMPLFDGFELIDDYGSWEGYLADREALGDAYGAARESWLSE